MNDSDYIKAAVELADGSHWATLEQVPNIGKRVFVDALAAQLVRQVDALENIYVSTIPSGSSVWEGHAIEGKRDYVKSRGSAGGPDRTMNTICCVVDSTVLAAKEQT